MKTAKEIELNWLKDILKREEENRDKYMALYNLKGEKQYETKMNKCEIRMNDLKKMIAKLEN